jgi:hypothetical protein
MALTKAEMRVYSQRIAMMLGWIARARRRLEQRQEWGRIHQLSMEAENALLALKMAAHYEAVEGAGGTTDRK